MEQHCDRIRLELPATTKYLNVLGACLDGIVERIDGIAEPRITAYNIQLAVNEIVANIITHAYAEKPDGCVSLTATVIPEPLQLLVELYDTGHSFDPSAVPEPDLDDVQIHGYGLFLARSLMDEVTYTPGPDGNCWQLIKYL